MLSKLQIQEQRQKLKDIIVNDYGGSLPLERLKECGIDLDDPQTFTDSNINKLTTK